MNYHYLLTFPLLILLGACSSQPKRVNEEISRVIDVDLNSKKENAADFFDYDHSIVLETTDDCLIKHINKIQFYEENIYILDSGSGCLFVFNQDGSFQYKISKKGESPEEYLSIDDFFIDKEKRCVYVYDGRSGSILVLDLYGNFQNRFKVFEGYSFFKLGNGNWSFYLANSASKPGYEVTNNLLWYDENFQIVKEEFPINRELLGRRYVTGWIKNTFSVYNGHLFFLPLMSNRIYKYSPEAEMFNIEYEVRYGVSKYNLVIDEHTESDQLRAYIDGMNKGEIPSGINNFHEIDSTVIFNFSFNRIPFVFLYDRNHDTGRICKLGFHESGLIFGSPSIFFTDQENKLILNIVDSSLFTICKDKDTEASEVIEDISKRIGEIEDTNPILVFYSLKNN